MRERTTTSLERFFLLILIASCLLVFFTKLGTRSLWEPDEGRYAEISREMVVSGDWLTPRLNYIKHFNKPPIAYWLIGSSFKLFGMNEGAARLPLAFIGLLGVIATYYIGKQLFGARCGFLAGIILITSLGYPILARIVSADIVFTFFCLLCYFFFVKRRYALFFVALGLAFATKGPVAFIIVLAPLLVFSWYARQSGQLRALRSGRGWVLFAVIGLPWYLYQAYINKGLLRAWIFEETIYRIVSEGKQPFYFFIPIVAGLLLPWICFLVPALVRNLSFQRQQLDSSRTSIFLLFLWFIIPFVFFSCIGKKLVTYALPLLTPLAIMIARFWDKAIDEPALLRRRIFGVCFYALAVFLAAFAIGFSVVVARGLDTRLGIGAARIDCLVLALIAVVALIRGLIYFKRGKPAHLFTTIAVAGTLSFLVTIDLLPRVGEDINKSIKPLAQIINEEAQPQDAIVNYRCFLMGLPFYTGRRVIVVERMRNIVYEESAAWKDYLLAGKNELVSLLFDAGKRVFCVAPVNDFKELAAAYPDSLYILGETGKYILFSNRQKN